MSEDNRRPMHGSGIIGAHVGSYHVLEMIGRGGMAEVYRARDDRLGRQVALKILAPHLLYDERFRLRFARESRTVASIDHPHIIPIFEAGEADGMLFIAMRLVAGRDLRMLLIEEGVLPLDRVGLLFTQVASALDAAHEHGLVHRDVKPANILIAGGSRTGDSGEHPEHVYLTDFGLTKSTTSMSGLTSQGNFVGTPRYIAPEQITGDQVDGRCDLYALACVVYESLAGVPPFERDTQLGLIYAHVSDEARPLTTHRPDLPPEVDVVMARALAKSPASRQATCAEFVREFREALSGEPVSDPRITPFGVGSSTGGGSSPWTTAAQSQPTGPGRWSASDNTLPPTSRSDRRRLPGRLIGIAFAVIVALIAAAALFLHGGGGTTRYPGSSAAPFSFEYPKSWQIRTHADVFVIASPKVSRFEELFQTPVNDNWTGIDKLSGGSSQGIYAAVSDNLTVPATAPNNLAYLLPGKVGVTGSAQITVGGQPGTRVEGSISDPAQTSRLDFTAVIVPRPSANAAYLVYFCAPGHCDNGMLTRMISSLKVVS
jgi:serine/threonine-protein kinase